MSSLIEIRQIENGKNTIYFKIVLDRKLFHFSILHPLFHFFRTLTEVRRKSNEKTDDILKAP